MVKDLVAAVTGQMDATQKRPDLLFELGLTSTIRFVASNANIVFPTSGGFTYTAKTISLSGVSQALEGQIGRVTIKFDNVSRDMAAYANIENFKGKTLVVKRVYLDAMGDTLNYNEVFSGIMETPSSIGRNWLTVSATSGKPLYKKSLTFAYQRQCPWKFGGGECNSDGLVDLNSSLYTMSGTVDSGTDTTFISSDLFGGTDYWQYGNVFLVKDGITYKRKVKSYVSSTKEIELNVEMPFAIDSTVTYTVYKGCDKTYDMCGSQSATPGPNLDNSLNFGGCIHITSATEAT